ncbi:MAG: hypothetical protein ACJ8AX_09615 [Gemmatimonadales bacterium]
MIIQARRVVAALEIAGGFVGMAVASSSAAASGLSLLQRLIIGSIGIPFALCAYAGRELWFDLPRGYPLSLLVQALQIPAWSSASMLYLFHCGAQYGVWIGKTGMAPMWGLGSRFTLVLMDHPRGEALGLNFLAIVALVVLVIDRVTSRGVGIGAFRARTVAD